VYQISIDAETQDEAIKHLYENKDWLEPTDFRDFKLEHVAMGDVYEKAI
jgi:hypothetical protein